MSEKPLLKELSRVFALLNKRDKRKLLAVTFLQIVFGILDLLGVAAIGVVTALAFRGIKSQGPGDKVEWVLEVTKLSDFDFQQQVILLSTFAVLIFTSKTIFSVFFLRKTLFYLSRKSSEISTNLTSKLLNQQLTFIKSTSVQQRLFELTTGVSNVTVGVLTNIVLIVSDLSLLAVLLLGLFLVDPIICLSTLAVFASIGFLLYFLLHTRATKNGKLLAKETIKSNQSISEAILSFREIFVKDSQGFYARTIQTQRNRLAKYDAELKFLPSISKYTSELAVVIGITAIAALQFARHDTNHAVAVLSIFVAASTRIAPAVMRLQQSAITVKAYLGSAIPTLDLADELRHTNTLEASLNTISIDHQNFVADVNFDGVSFSYDADSGETISNVSIKVPTGTMTAIVGPSGGGKSTLVDLILGILRPEKGTVLLSGLSPNEAIKAWPGSIGYVPQEVFISNGTIRDNICLGFDPMTVDEELIWDALKAADLDEFVRSVEGQLEFVVGDNGGSLSGGQRQRIGIARCLLTKPTLVILDEATSALDSATENRISESIMNLRGSCTVIVVAHRLSTVRNSDQVVYFENGEVVAFGTFEDVKANSPKFQEQAEFMGL
jgi:ABC-type multidrug transport system fused ATPase/permease subunit